MALMRMYDPFGDLDELHQQMRDMMRGNFSNQSAITTPVSDVYMEGEEGKENMVVEAHLPNFAEEEVGISVEDHALVIRAEHKEKEEKDGKKDRKYILRESTSSFYRRIGLPKNVDTDSVEADFDKGVLKVTVPFKDLPKPKQIRIGGKK